MKKVIVCIILAALVASSAWAQFYLGGTGAVYANTDQSLENIVNLFEEGEGVFYGPLVELGMGSVSLGAALNWSYYHTVYNSMLVRMVDYDMNGYLQAHMGSIRSFIDPFLEVGFGMVATDYAENEEDPDTSNPLRATNYFQAGGGIGLNLGKLGVFAKALYMIPSGEPVIAEINGFPAYTLAEYPLKPLKVFLGGKIRL